MNTSFYQRKKETPILFYFEFTNSRYTCVTLSSARFIRFSVLRAVQRFSFPVSNEFFSILARNGVRKKSIYIYESQNLAVAHIAFVYIHECRLYQRSSYPMRHTHCTSSRGLSFFLTYISSHFRSVSRSLCPRFLYFFYSHLYIDCSYIPAAGTTTTVKSGATLKNFFLFFSLPLLLFLRFLFFSLHVCESSGSGETA